MDFIGEINGLLTEVYEPKKKSRYVDLHNRLFPFEKVDVDCVYCGSKAFYKLIEYKNLNMATTETVKTKKYSLINEKEIVTVKLFGGRFSLSKDTDQATLEAAFKAGYTEYVKVD